MAVGINNNYVLSHYKSVTYDPKSVQLITITHADRNAAMDKYEVHGISRGLL